MLGVTYVKMCVEQLKVFEKELRYSIACTTRIKGYCPNCLLEKDSILNGQKCAFVKKMPLFGKIERDDFTLFKAINSCFEKL